MARGVGGIKVVIVKIFDSMEVSDIHAVVTDIPQPIDCLNCDFCLRVKLLEMGLVPGTHIRIEKEKWGINIVHLLNEVGVIETTLALRSEELGRVCLQPETCPIAK